MGLKRSIDLVAVPGLFLLLAALVMTVAARNFGLHPIVFSDELSYSKFSRLVEFEDASLPNYLYYFIYKSTNICGNYYLECSRALNLAFYLGAIPFIYLIGARVATKRLALLVGVASFAGASNSYTAYYMPEAMYFFAFWAISWLALKFDTSSSFKDICIVGASVGAASLVKPHALFLLPGFAVYFWYVISGVGLVSARRAGLGAILLIATALGVKLTLGLIMAGPSGITLFGTFYAPYAQSAALSGFARYKSLLLYTVFSFKGHILALICVYAVPIASLLAGILDALKGRSKEISPSPRTHLAVYALLTLLSLISVSALFTASISDSTPGNHLHIRYYFFALPLLLLLAASSTRPTTLSRISRISICLPILSLLSFAVISKLGNYEVYSSTAPEIYGIEAIDRIFTALGVISAVSLVAWAFKPKLGAQIYLFVYIPVMITASLSMVSAQLSNRNTADDFDLAGIMARAKLSPAALEKTVIVGDQGAIGGLFRTLYYLDTKDLDYLKINSSRSSIHGIAPYSDFSVDEVSPDKLYLLVIGNHEIIGATKDIQCTSSFCLKQIIR